MDGTSDETEGYYLGSLAKGRREVGGISSTTRIQKGPEEMAAA